MKLNIDIKSIKELLADKEKFAERIAELKEKVSAIKLKKTKPKIDEKPRKKRKFKLPLRSFLYSFSLTVSIAAIFIVFYEYRDLFMSEESENKANNRKIVANLNYSVSYMLKKLETGNIKRKNLRAIIRKLNGENQFGIVNKFSPCNNNVLAFGEYPDTGNVVVIKPARDHFVIIAYDCSIQPIESRTIALKLPPAPARKPHKKISKHNKHGKDTAIKPHDEKHAIETRPSEIKEGAESENKTPDKYQDSDKSGHHEAIAPDNTNHADVKTSKETKLPVTHKPEPAKIINKEQTEKPVVEAKSEHLTPASGANRVQHTESVYKQEQNTVNHH